MLSTMEKRTSRRFVNFATLIVNKLQIFLKKNLTNINQKFHRPYFKPFIPLTMPEIVFRSRMRNRVGPKRCLVVRKLIRNIVRNQCIVSLCVCVL